jgi:hypothetical protein
VNSYCDYGFVPELVPSGRFEVLNESDDFFMLELQPVEQEKHFLCCGKPTIKQIARELSVWTTQEHRRFAEIDVVFHSSDLPPVLETVREQAAVLTGRLHGMMNRTPMDHVRHPYWVLGVDAWLTRQRVDTDTDAKTPLPPECGPLYPRAGHLHLVTSRNAYLRTLGRLRRLAGVKPNVPIWHHEWLDSRLVLNWIAAIKDPPHRGKLLVSTPHSPLARWLEKTEGFDVIYARDLMDDEALSQWLKVGKRNSRYCNVLCHVYRSDVRQTRRILEGLGALLDDDAAVAVFIDHEAGETDPSNFSWELAQYVHEVVPGRWTGLRISAIFTGGHLKRRLRLIERRLLRHLWPVTWKTALLLPFVVFLWPMVAGATALNNWRLRHSNSSCPPFCSSALLCLSGPTALALTNCDRKDLDCAATGRPDTC